jgi:hypothetical protein
VSLPTTPRRRVVDAGYYDNYGVSLAGSWLFSARNAAWIDEHASKILLVQIRDSVSEPERTLARVTGSAPDLLAQATEELSSPLEGLYNGAFAAAAFRNDGMLELLSSYFRANRLLRAGKKFDQAVRDLLKPAERDKAWLVRHRIEDRLRVLAADPGQPLKTLFGSKNLLKTIRPVLEDLPWKNAEQFPKELRVPLHAWLRSFFSVLDEHRPADENRYFTTVTFEYTGKAALSWYLCRTDWRRIEEAIQPGSVPPGNTDVSNTVGAIIKWWTAEVEE